MEVRDRGACETIYRLNEPKRFPPNYFDLFADKLREGGSSVLVAEIDGVVRGLGAIRIVRYPILDVASLTFGMVHPEYQNRGLGTALLLARLARLPRPRRRWLVLLMTTGGSETFYQRFGFTFHRMLTDERGTDFGSYRIHLFPRDWDRCHALLDQWKVRLENA